MPLSSARRGVSPLRAVGAATVAAVVLSLLAGGTASAGLPLERGIQHRPAVKKVTVPREFFGVHDAQLNALGRPGTGSIRLWDTGTAWPQIQPTPTTWDFTRLDQIVRDAWRSHTEVTMVAAMTPDWALADPSQVGSTQPPTVSAYSQFLATLMDRYRNYRGSGRPGIANYQVWNEANIGTFWTGSTGQMAQLVKAAYDVRNAHDPRVRVVAPAMVTRLAYQQKGIASFYRERIGGRPVWRYVDALSFNLYPRDRVPVSAARPNGPTRPATPEDSMVLLSQVRAVLAADHVPASIPIWDTEINYGLVVGAKVPTPARAIPSSLQVAYVLRTFLLNAAQGIRRVDWYAYDMGTVPSGGGTIGNTLLTKPAASVRAQGILTPAGRAFTRVQSWLKGGTLVGTATKRPCIEDHHGTYTCTIRYAKGTGRVYWNPYGHARITLVRSARTKVDQYGATTRARGHSTLRIGSQPVLVRSTQ